MLNGPYPSEIDSYDETAFIIDAAIDEYQRIMTNIFNRMRSVVELEALCSGSNIKIPPGFVMRPQTRSYQANHTDTQYWDY